MNNVILCAVDFSDTSSDVLKYAVNLSKQKKMPVTILYTYRLLNGNSVEPLEARKKIEDTAREKFSHLEKDILVGSGVQYDFKVEVGFVSNRIREFAKKNDLSFLVIGKSTSPGDIESVDEISNNLHVPLVIVP